MSPSDRPVSYTEIEIRSFLPSGWGIRPGSTGRLDPKSGQWSIEVYDGADNVWKVAVEGRAAASLGRLDALRASVDQLQRKSLGRKSVLTG